MAELVLASGNKGKLAELQQALGDLGWTLRPISDWTQESPEENGDSFAANALIKARHAAAISGLPSLADDSGLAVDALDGAPGIHSARYAGEHGNDAANNQKLLEELAKRPGASRQARFHCVIALVRDAQDPEPLIADGQWEGEILNAPQGQGGFGYDPLFLDPDSGLSAAQLSPAEKLARSHRGRAVRELRRRLQSESI